MPAGWDEFTVTELASVLSESRGAAEGLLDLAYVLAVKLPGTRAAFRDGTLRESKVKIIARATTVLDPAEARAAEALVLDRAGQCRRAGQRRAAGSARRQRWRARRPGPARRASRGLGASRVCRPGQPDRPAGDPAGPGRPARRDPGHRPDRPRAGPGPGRLRRPESQDDVVRDGDRRAGARHRARLRPARTYEPRPTPGQTRQACPAGRTRSARRDERHLRAGILLHGLGPARATRWLWYLAATDQGRQAGPDRRARPDHHGRL